MRQHLLMCSLFAGMMFNFITQTHAHTVWRRNGCVQCAHKSCEVANETLRLYIDKPLLFLVCVLVIFFPFVQSKRQLASNNRYSWYEIFIIVVHTQHIHTNIHSLGEKEGQIAHEHIIYDKTHWNIVDCIARVCFCFHIWPHSTNNIEKKKKI